ncbi:MAG: hypothetical protein H6577_25175 [Lewinellaceae bacterium]|nr:hypothetical protein [Lewinellaceae bacterium]
MKIVKFSFLNYCPKIGDNRRPLDERVYSHMFLNKLQAKGLMELFTKEEEISKGNRTTILRKRFMKITNEGRRFLNKAIYELDLG